MPEELDENPETGAPQPETTASPPTSETPVDWRVEADKWKVEADKWKTLSRRNESTAKNNKAAADAQSGLLVRVAAALGLDQDHKPDPEAVAAQIQAKDKTIRDLQVRNGLADVLAKHAADPVLTRAVLADSGVLHDVDPAASDFAEQLDAAVARALEEHPKLRSAPLGPVKSGAEQHSGGQTSQPRPTNITDAISSHYR